jgi:NAD(P)-dependent dehydrogenase (short-subunit alcohol dehydrogenase family)
MSWLWSSRNVWTAADMPPQEGKVAIVTGANCGIGFITALELAKHGAHVVLACRSALRGRQAEQDIRVALAAEDTILAAKGRAEYMPLDVADPKSVRAFADEFKRRFDRLDLLINNAGVAVPPKPTTGSGLEAHFAINYLGHFYLTSLLMDLLLQSKAARVVNISSMLHRFGWLFLNFANVATKSPRVMDGYCISKLLNLLFTYELHRRLSSRQVGHVKVVAAHPGICDTEIFKKYYRNNLPAFLAAVAIWLLSWLPLQSPSMGALPTLYAATVEDVASGDFYGPEGVLTARGYPVKEQSDSTSHSLEHAAKLWELSERTLEVKFDV